MHRTYDVELFSLRTCLSDPEVLGIAAVRISNITTMTGYEPYGYSGTLRDAAGRRTRESGNQRFRKP
jgi:hypothetical protein